MVNKLIALVNDLLQFINCSCQLQRIFNILSNTGIQELQIILLIYSWAKFETTYRKEISAQLVYLKCALISIRKALLLEYSAPDIGVELRRPFRMFRNYRDHLEIHWYISSVLVYCSKRSIPNSVLRNVYALH